MIVIDASALASYILREEGYGKMRDYLDRHRVVSVDMVAKEVSNAILIAFRRRRISKDDAEKAFKALLHMLNKVVELYPETEVLSEAFTIANSTGLTIYDSLYIALAKKLKVQLITGDRRQFEASNRVNVLAYIV